MLFTWEELDIKAGRHLGQSNGAEEQWMIGYDPGADNRRFALISLSDGAIVLTRQTRESMAAALNKSKYVPLSL